MKIRMLDGKCFSGKNELEIVANMRDSSFTPTASIKEYLASCCKRMPTTARATGTTDEERCKTFIASLIESGIAEIVIKWHMSFTTPGPGRYDPQRLISYGADPIEAIKDAENRIKKLAREQGIDSYSYGIDIKVLHKANECPGRGCTEPAIGLPNASAIKSKIG